MPKFSKSSKRKLETCHQDLQTIFNYVIKHFDCTVICGNRSKEDQDKAYNEGFSKVKFPNSKHNSCPSMAADVVPYPIEWKNLDRMRFFAGYVLGVAEMLYAYGAISHKLTSGLDWDNDTRLSDTRFIDAPHFQLK